MPTWYHCGYGNCTKKFSTQQGCRRHRTSCKQAKVQWRKERAAYEAAAEPVIQDTVMADPGTPEPPEEPAAAPGPRRSSRLRRKPKPVPEIIPKVSEPVVPPATAAPNRSKYHTKPNAFGVFRVYHSPPTTNPDAGQTLDDVADAPSFTQSVGEEKRWWKGFGKKAKDKILAPFLNATVFRLFNWYYAATNFLSRAHLQRLVNEVLLAPDFKLADLVDFSVERELKRLDSTDPDVSPYAGTYGWTTSTLKIPLPCEGVKCAEGKAPVLELEGLVHRSLAEVIETAFSDSSSKSFHYTPFWEYWKPKPGAPPQRILSEVYTADVFLEEHERLGKMPRIPGDPDDLEYAIAAILIWSDSTHLANFGDASLWPIYIFFGNQSKYERGKPSMFAAHHLAYIPSLPKDLQEQYQAAFNGTPASSSTITHLQREVIQAVWNHLLSDPEFMKAYKDGIVVTCGDGRKRRLFPRFFFYSADYPEKVKLATIQHLAKHACPTCLTKKKYYDDLGTLADERRRNRLRKDDKERQQRVAKARKKVFAKGVSPGSTSAFKETLGKRSEVPTQNSFSKYLSPFGLNFFDLFVPDVLHEVELGIWKGIFTHLVRVLYSVPGNLVQTLNRRYRAIPTFGRGTIRRFGVNASAMKKLAGRNFEDLLQCSIPAFVGLLPGTDGEIIHQLLFAMCLWHGFAKLRLHTTATIAAFKAVNRELGFAVRRFRRMGSKYDTRELPGEHAARKRRKAKPKSAASTTTSTKKGKGRRSQKANKPAPAARPRLFNLHTFKWHAIGHIFRALSWFGTTDNYSTQVGELEHRRVKRFYARTNKIKGFERQIARHFRRQCLLRGIAAKLARAEELEALIAQQLRDDGKMEPKESIDARASVPFESDDPLPFTSPLERYHISKSDAFPINVLNWIEKNPDDLAFTNFMPDLFDHLLSRLRPDADPNSFTDDDLDDIFIMNDTLYKHKVLRINYTTYDMRRDQDSINPNTEHCHIMTIADEDENPVDVQTGKPVLPHPYWYARVVGIFSAYVVHRSNPTARFKGQKMDFVWVRWLGRNLDDGVEGFEKGFFQRVGFLPAEEGEAFGFVDPAAIIRAAHIIPALEFEQVDNLLGPSVTRRQGEPPLDYPDYYVNPFPDRDMLFRFIGGAPGHGHPLPYYPLHPLELYGNHAPATNSDHASESDSEAESEESDGEQDPQLAQQLLRDEVDDYAYEIEEEQEVGTGEGLGSGDDSDEDGMNEDDGEESERDSDDEADSDQSELGAEDGEEIYSFIDDPATFGYGDL